jgi:hypothetical protein
LPHPLHIGLVAEVISIGRFAQPPALAGGFAGPAAIGGRTELLAGGIMAVGSEEVFAAAALASGVLGCHRDPIRKKTKRPTQSQMARGRRKKIRRKKKFSAEPLKKITGKKTDFQTARNPPLSTRP